MWQGTTPAASRSGQLSGAVKSVSVLSLLNVQTREPVSLFIVTKQSVSCVLLGHKYCLSLSLRMPPSAYVSLHDRSFSSSFAYTICYHRSSGSKRIKLLSTTCRPSAGALPPLNQKVLLTRGHQRLRQALPSATSGSSDPETRSVEAELSVQPSLPGMPLEIRKLIYDHFLVVP